MKLALKIITPLLLLLSGLYGLCSQLRNWLFDTGVLRSYRSSLPVICVGNCTVGGTGKTPLVRELIPLLRKRGLVPVILSRGYGGTIVGPHQVLSSDSAAHVGDEPALLALDVSLPVVISRSRVKGAQYIEKQKLGTVIILDDGYQHRSLERTLNVLCLNVADIEAQNKILTGRYLPWGIFRESLRAAFRRADLLVFSFRSQLVNPSTLKNQLIELIPNKLPILYSAVDSARVISVQTKQVLSAQKVTVLCAIANPEGFLLTLTQLGFELDSVHVLTDHSALVAEHCARLIAESTLPIVVTEKDLIKIPQELRTSARIYVTEISLKLDPQEVLSSLLARL